MSIQLERLLEADLLFGLAVRFFGVFAVLLVLMLFMYASGWVFRRYMGGEKDPAAAAQAERGGALPDVPTRVSGVSSSPGDDVAPVSGEVAAVVALCIRDSAASLAATGLPVPGETAAAIALALSAHPGEDSIPLHRHGSVAPAAFFPSRDCREQSPWTLLGRQESLSRNDPWTGRRSADREPTNREPKV